MIKIRMHKLLLTCLILSGFCMPTQAAELLFLTPAAVGSYGTYKTLTDQPGFFGNSFARACTKFSNAMSQQTDSQHPSTAVRAFFTNLKCFKTHEKMAMVGSGGALLLGAILASRGFIGSLACLYKYLRATNDEEKELRGKELAKMIYIGFIGYISLGVGITSSLLLADYAQSANAA